MTKARDISSLIGAGGIIDNSKITLDANEIPSLDTAKITTGTFADARISQSSVSQHATTFDDSKIQQDLMVLALQQATDANKSAYSLSNSFIEQFEDSSGIDVQTNTFRNASEYVNSVSAGSTTLVTPSSLTFGGSGLYADNEANRLIWSKDGSLTTGSFMVSASASTAGFAILDLGSSKRIAQIDIGKSKGYGDVTQILLQGSIADSNGNTFGVDWSGASSSVINSFTNSGAFTPPNLSNFTSNGYVNWGFIGPQGVTFNGGVMCRVTNFNPFYARYLRVQATQADFADANYAITEFALYEQSLISNATGNFTSVSKTAPATVSKMGIVVLYKNNSGTATLNTDLVAQVSANNGTDYTTVTLTPRGTFSTGINIAVANNVTVTSGTSCKYKISFANQSAGTKETQVHGIGLLY
jgi:hypothetical protein